MEVSYPRGQEWLKQDMFYESMKNEHKGCRTVDIFRYVKVESVSATDVR